MGLGVVGTSALADAGGLTASPCWSTHRCTPGSRISCAAGSTTSRSTGGGIGVSGTCG